MFIVISNRCAFNQCYHELSAVLAGRTGPAANWCTFATWASRQAGQTIRKEDLARLLERRLNQSTLALRASQDVAAAMHSDLLFGPAARPPTSIQTVAAFCEQLRDGYPPIGQGYLRRAFRRYAQALAEGNRKNRAELIFLANLEIGFHEQTRLQPEIAESLEAGWISFLEFARPLFRGIFPANGWFHLA